MPTPQRRLRRVSDPNVMPGHVDPDLKQLSDAIRRKCQPCFEDPAYGNPVMLDRHEAALVYRALFGDLRG
jgi:hypothetical protein